MSLRTMIPTLPVVLVLLTQTVPVTAKPARPANGSTRGANVVTHKELHEAAAMLKNADHDYQGHRAKALEEVHKALHALGHHHTPQAANAANGNAVNGNAVNNNAAKPQAGAGRAAPKMPQATSDAHLRTAREKLSNAEGLLALSKHAQHQVALTHVASAIASIDAALKVK